MTTSVNYPSKNKCNIKQVWFFQKLTMTNICNNNVKMCSISIKHSQILPHCDIMLIFKENAVDLTENKFYYVMLIKYTNTGSLLLYQKYPKYVTLNQN